MHIRLICLLAPLALAACQSPPIEDLSYGSWLDRVAQRRPVQALTPEQAEALAQVRARAEEVRLQMAHEPSRVVRVSQLRELKELGDRQRALETRPPAPRAPEVEPPSAGG